MTPAVVRQDRVARGDQVPGDLLDRRLVLVGGEAVHDHDGVAVTGGLPPAGGQPHAVGSVKRRRPRRPRQAPAGGPTEPRRWVPRLEAEARGFLD